METGAGELALAIGAGGREEVAADGVHGDAVVDLVDGGEQADDVDLAALTQDVERPGAVLAAAPGEERAGFHFLSSTPVATRRISSAVPSGFFLAKEAPSSSMCSTWEALTVVTSTTPWTRAWAPCESV